jgi:hypothetical protein
MVTATTTRRPSKAEAPAAPTTFAEVAAAKMADTLTKYRAYVARAAGGESLTAEELDKVLELAKGVRAKADSSKAQQGPPAAPGAPGAAAPGTPAPAPAPDTTKK